MNEYRVSHLVEVMLALSDTASIAEKACLEGLRDKPVNGTLLSKDLLMVNLESLRRQCEALELQKARLRLGDIIAHEHAGSLTFDRVRIELHELREDVDYELNFRKFAYVTTSRATKLHDFVKEWHLVWKAYPTITKDAQAATDSYALELYTASVFHSMRIAEFGLRMLAKRLRVKITHKAKQVPVEFGTWDEIITQVRKRIEKAHQLPKGAARERELAFYANAADRCGYIKDLWRNPVAHARKTYNEGEALDVLDRVRGFMMTLANKVGGNKRRKEP